MLIGGAVRGRTNELIQVESGTHTITLAAGAEGRLDFLPARVKCTLRKKKAPGQRKSGDAE